MPVINAVIAAIACGMIVGVVLIVTVEVLASEASK